jgi:hypothetical protein
MITRHASGDWGDLDEEDKRENQLSPERLRTAIAALI